MRGASDFFLGTIEGPILGLNLVLLAAFLIAVIWPTPVADHWAAAVAGLTGLVVLLTPGKGAYKSWCAAFGGLLLVVAFIDSLSTVDSILTTDPNYSMRVSPLIGGFAMYMRGFIIVVLLLGLVVNTGIAGVALKWALFRNPDKKLNLTDKERNDRNKTYEVQVFVAALATRLWMTLIPVLWFFVFSLTPRSINSGLLTPENIKILQSGGTPLYGLNWFILLLILTGGIISAITFSRNAPKKRAYAADTRVIAGSALVGSVIISAILYLAGTIWLFITVMPDLNLTSFPEFMNSFGQLTRGFAGVDVPTANTLQSSSSWYLGILKESSYYGWMITAAIGVLAFFFREGILTGLDFALDVTMYFEEKAALDHTDKHVGDVPEDVKIHKNIMERFKAVVADVLVRNKNATVLFVTHSQGTALTGDFLSKANLSFLEKHNLDKAKLVTMGSPISHIYQYYFLPDFWNRKEPEVGTSMAKWINLHRDADYIGKEIIIDSVENRNIGKGGHTGYFKDPRVQNVLETERLVPFNATRTHSTEPIEIDTEKSLKNQVAFWLFFGLTGLSIINFCRYAYVAGKDFWISGGIAFISAVSLFGLAYLLDTMARKDDALREEGQKARLGFLKDISNLLIFSGLLGAITLAYLIFHGNSSMGIAFLASVVTAILAQSFYTKSRIDDRLFWNHVSNLTRKELEHQTSLTCEDLVPESFGIVTTDEHLLEEIAYVEEHDSIEAIKAADSDGRRTINGKVWVREQSKHETPARLNLWTFTLNVPKGRAIRKNEAINWAEMMPQKGIDLTVKTAENHIDVSIVAEEASKKEIVGA